MSSPAQKSVATHSVRYVTANMLGIVAGFISFPIMTRLLDTTQYGIFGYFDAWLALLIAVSKLGGQHSIIRFYPHTRTSSALSGYAANFILAPFLASCALWILTAAVYACVLYAVPSTRADAWIGWLILFSLPLNVWISYVGGVLLAQEHSDISAKVTVAQRWLEAALILALVYFVQRSALSVYIARLVIVVFFGWALWSWLRKRIPLSLRDFQRSEFSRGMHYGLPLVVNEIVHVLLAFLDRFMLLQMLKDFAIVGAYTIGYGLALAITRILNTAITAAYTQVSVREFETLGPIAVVRTKKNILDFLVYFSAAIIVGLVVVGGDVLMIFAGNDKRASIPVFVVVSVSYVLDGMIGICSTGLLLHKRSKTELGLTACALVVNVALNLLWIPQFGLMGAVYATFLSYLALGISRYFFCPPELRALPSLYPTCMATALAALAYGTAMYTNLLGASSHLGRLGVMVAMTIVLLVLPALALDAKLRGSLKKYLRRNAS
ncbi:MAG: oligosaccharide flippase family protein [Rudaea sp.]